MEYTFDSDAGPGFAVSPDVGVPLAVGAEVGLTLAGRGVVLVRS